ncbi:TetR/AcrR family transcriptional regulator [Micromonospora echinofusca]|uniref:TetR family transcriptional regulator n=1 Tax=Micromonospora echinofusca TaxID=47858 RepID=A0ABS3VU72_MICEH|nr:TetR/AcrR family transcriptional regulator [Micromonospora echinofusca]MBO4208087.1 TetR family transcriptional regulator [Micromonospora echinofusca]
MTAPTRRERLRTATVTEIKDGARRLLVTGGPEAVSLRAIARDMGMTAPAIYRYFPSLEALVAAVAGDLYDELRSTIEAARDGAGDEPVGQLIAMARAFRNWSVTHPAEFGLLFGAPTPGLDAFVAGCGDADHPGARFGAVFAQPLLDLWQRTPFRTPPPEVIRQRLGDRLEPLRLSHGEIPIEVAYTFLAGWTRLYGLVAMEVFRQLTWAVTEPEALFESEMAMFLDELGNSRQVLPPAGSAD